MTPAARVGGLTLSLFLHAGAIAALLAWSGTEWAHPLFVDLLERSEPPAGAPSAGAPAETSRRASAPEASGRVARHENGSTRPTLARPRPAPSPPPEAPAPPPTPPPPLAAPTPSPPSPQPIPEPPRAAAAPNEPAPVPAAPLAPSAPPTESERSSSSGSSSGSAQTGESGSDAAASSGGGSPLAKAGPGGGGGTAPAEYGPYLARFRQRVQETLIYPLAARRQGVQGTVELDVWLEASGRVRDVRVVRSSSNELLDEAALETIRRLGPVPFPDSLPRRPLLIRLPLVFELR
jgi:periplasmic protein TonB